MSRKRRNYGGQTQLQKDLKSQNVCEGVVVPLNIKAKKLQNENRTDDSAGTLERFGDQAVKGRTFDEDLS